MTEHPGPTRRNVFVAVPVPEYVVAALADASSRHAHHGYIPADPATFHVTVLFARQADPDQSAALAEAVTSICLDTAPFVLSYSGLAGFPGARVAVALVADGVVELEALWDRCHGATRVPGLDMPSHPGTDHPALGRPHTTIGRWAADRDPADLPAVIDGGWRHDGFVADHLAVITTGTGGWKTIAACPLRRPRSGPT